MSLEAALVLVILAAQHAALFAGGGDISERLGQFEYAQVLPGDFDLR